MAGLQKSDPWDDRDVGVVAFVRTLPHLVDDMCAELVPEKQALCVIPHAFCTKATFRQCPGYPAFLVHMNDTPSGNLSLGIVFLLKMTIGGSFVPSDIHAKTVVK